MKNTFKYLVLALIAAATSVSCTKESVNQNNIPSEDVKLTPLTISATGEATLAKSYVSGLSIFWENTDKLSVYDAIAGDVREFTLVEGAGTKSGKFTGEVTPGASTLWAVSPASAALGLETGDILTVSLPAAQRVNANNTAINALVAVGKGTSAGLSMKNVNGFLKVTVTKDNISSIKITGTAIAGKIKVNAATGVITDVVETSDIITITPKEGDDVFAVGDYYAALLPGTTTAGNFSVEMITEGATTIAGVPCGAKATLTEDITINRNAGLKFSDNNAVFSYGYHIYNTTQLSAWNAGEWAATDVVYLEDDIDMSDIDSWTVKDFAGKFYGQNHILKKINISIEGDACFLGDVTGIIQDVTFGETSDGSCFTSTASGTENAYATPIRRITGSGALAKNIKNNADIIWNGTTTGVAYIGGIVGSTATSKATVQDCVNNGMVRTASTVYGNINVGGVVAAHGASTIKNCVNNGTLEVSNEYQANMRLGGISGYCGSSGKILSCTNNGLVVLSGTKTVADECTNAIGGILGFNKNEATIITNCTNNGIVRKTGVDKTNQNYLAGIVALATGAMEVTGCFNESTATIENTGASNGKHMYLGGIMGYNDSNAATVTGCTNNGTINNTASATYFYMGGIVGRANTAIILGSETAHCVNNGQISNSATSSHGSAGTDISIGGIIGRCTLAGAQISYCDNTGKVYNPGKVKTENSVTALGGIIGSTTNSITMDNCTNGAVIENANGGAKFQFYIGGIMGYCEGSSDDGTVIDNCSNLVAGSIQNTAEDTKYNCLGGIIGYVKGTAKVSLTECSNAATLSSTSKSTNAYLGGIVGSLPDNSNSFINSIYSCTNSGNITCTGIVTSTERMGGIIGDCAATANVETCTNSGTLSNNSESVVDVRLGGIVASNTTNGCSIKSCTNSGSISNTTTGTLASGYFSGILSYKTGTLGTISSNVNEGNISVSATAITKNYVGGVLAYSTKGGIVITGGRTNCSIVSIEGTESNRIGMISGYCDSPKFTKIGVAGSCNGTTLTTGNWTSYLVGYANKSSAGINISGDSNSCYFISE